MARIPDKEAYQRAWSGMAFRERREILRAVARGQPMRRRKDARLAVATARQQQSYWKYAWLIAPAVSLISIPNWALVAVQAVLLSGLMGGYAWHRIRRARQAEEANLGRLDGRTPPPPKPSPTDIGIGQRIGNWFRSILP